MTASEINILLDAHERQHSHEEEECAHAERECGHCIDCGEYVGIPDCFQETD